MPIKGDIKEARELCQKAKSLIYRSTIKYDIPELGEMADIITELEIRLVNLTYDIMLYPAKEILKREG